ncbi:OmpA family protein [uncultured Ferrimonas sp.]|uniref:OmpA family protein n=1 Tax=uncultured Ferrimonas sp. TaxID=432640 RepID=UPI0026080A14|nr:OmpA family protein [uncultured Ferrimonas sp.]
MEPTVEQADEHIDETGSWLSIGDLMAGLLMVFALLLVVTMAELYEYQEQSESNRIVIIEEIQKGLIKAGIESKVDLETGSLSLSEGLNFKHDGAMLSPAAKSFLDKLIPIYSQAIFLNDETSVEVLHLVIEGHAAKNEGKRKAMSLSLNRAEAVTTYIERMIFPYKGRFLDKALPAARGKLDADDQLPAQGNRKVVFRFEFKSHDLTELRGQ